MYKEILSQRNIEILSKKEVSLEHNERFIEILKNLGGPYCFAYVKVSENKDFFYGFIGNVGEQAECFMQILKDTILRFVDRINGNLYFFISFNDGIGYSPEVVDFIKNHIIMLGCYSMIERPGVEILIPDFYMLMQNHKDGYYAARNRNIPFMNRVPVAKFRGAQTGGSYNMDEVRKMEMPRLKAAHMSLENPSLLDVRFIYSYNVQCNGGQEYIDYMNNKFGAVSNSEPMENFNKNRYLLCFDGNQAPPFARPETIMVSGSVPIFQTNFHKYWGCFLKENKNYIKIKDDLSDLVEKIHYLNNNPEFAKKIARNARILADEVIDFNFSYEYFVDVLNTITAKISNRL